MAEENYGNYGDNCNDEDEGIADALNRLGMGVCTSCGNEIGANTPRYVRETDPDDEDTRLEVRCDSCGPFRDSPGNGSELQRYMPGRRRTGR